MYTLGFLIIELYHKGCLKSILIRVCKVIVTVLVRIAEGTEDTEDAEGRFGNFKVFSQLSGVL